MQSQLMLFAAAAAPDADMDVSKGPSVLYLPKRAFCECIVRAAVKCAGSWLHDHCAHAKPVSHALYSVPRSVVTLGNLSPRLRGWEHIATQGAYTAEDCCTHDQRMNMHYSRHGYHS